MTAASIAHLRIKLDDVEPAVVRRVEVPLTIRLDRLHLVLQAAMGWTNSHLYEIRARDVGWGKPDPLFGDGPLDASNARLIDVLEDVGARSLKYLYDFGDGWEHSVRISDAASGIAYPRLVDAVGPCLPEDVGGPCGYREFLDVLVDPDHEEHAAKLRWIGANFDPANADAEVLAQAVRGLTKMCTRKPSTPNRSCSAAFSGWIRLAIVIWYLTERAYFSVISAISRSPTKRGGSCWRLTAVVVFSSNAAFMP